MGFPGRDAESQVATSHTATHVATSKMMSQHQLSSAPFLLRRDTIFPCRDLPCCHPCRDLKNNVATSIPTSQITTQIFQVATPKGHPTSRPQFDVMTPIPLIQVATPFLVATSSCFSRLSSMSQPQNPSCHTLKPKPGRDLTSMSRLQITQPRSRHEIHVTTKANQSRPQPNQVATSNLGRDLTLEFGSSHSSFCLALKKKFFFFF